MSEDRIKIGSMVKVLYLIGYYEAIVIDTFFSRAPYPELICKLLINYHGKMVKVKRNLRGLTLID